MKLDWKPPEMTVYIEKPCVVEKYLGYEVRPRVVIDMPGEYTMSVDPETSQVTVRPAEPKFKCAECRCPPGCSCCEPGKCWCMDSDLNTMSPFGF